MVNSPGVTRYQPNFVLIEPSDPTNSGPATMTPSGHRPPTQSCPFPWLLSAPNSALEDTPDGGTNGPGRVTGHRAESAIVTGPAAIVDPVIPGDPAGPVDVAGVGVVGGPGVNEHPASKIVATAPATRWNEFLTPRATHGGRAAFPDGADEILRSPMNITGPPLAAPVKHVLGSPVRHFPGQHTDLQINAQLHLIRDGRIGVT